jgi:hypothetical protein
MILPAIHCRRCKTLMDLVATIQPIGIHPGLNAYCLHDMWTHGQ